MSKIDRYLRRLFRAQINYPKVVVAIGLALLALPFLFVGELTQDTRSDAFLSPDNPALIYRDVLKERFGLGDPLVVALHSTGQAGIYQKEVLRALVLLTDRLNSHPNIDADATVALPLEDNVTGNEDGLDIKPFIETAELSVDDLSSLRESVGSFPLYDGSLVSQDGSTSLIILELKDASLGAETYSELKGIVREVDLPQATSVHIAGEAAVSAYLGDYIDADAKRLNPLAATIILAVLILAYRRLTPAFCALLIVVGSVGWALGAMALTGIPFYVITNAMPVILIGIAVADTIHVFGHFYQLQARDPRQSRETLLLDTMSTLWRPISFTSLTTSAGFIGLYFAAEMPPFRYFGLFTAVGVVAAWLFSLTMLPALMVLLRVQVSQRQINRARSGELAGSWPVLAWLGSFFARQPAVIVGFFCAVTIGGGFAAMQLRVDADRIDLFASEEPIYIADKLINRYMDGTNTLDIVIESQVENGLIEPEALARIDSLQRYAESLPWVQSSSSVVDYLKQMNRSLNEGKDAAYRLPDDANMAAQYLMLYTFSTEPDSLESFIDTDYASANVRLILNTGRHSDISPVVESLQTYIDRELSGEDLRAYATGRVKLNYHWIKNIGDSHVQGLIAALIMVCVLTTLSFRSVVLGCIALTPVLVSIFIVYSFMWAADLSLEVGTSMFAAVAVGLGVDFAIHTVARIRQSMSAGIDVVHACEDYYRTTGKTLMLNALAVSAGFMVLTTSGVGQLRDFGSVVSLAMLSSFVTAALLVPALLVILSRLGAAFSPDTLRTSAGITTLTAALLGVGAISAPAARADGEDLNAQEIVKSINAVPQGETLSRSMSMRLTDKRGKVRESKTSVYRKYFGEERRSVMFYSAPANVRGTAFLSYDYAEPERADEQWLYLPALRKVRRVSAADRGDFFLGTDFSYEDIKLEGKLGEADYHYALAAVQPDDPDLIALDATTRSEVLVQELGYSKNLIVVNRKDWIISRVDFWDERGELLKTMTVKDVRKVDGFWTRHRLIMTNHKSGHTSELLFSDVDYQADIDDKLFSTRALSRGK